MYYVSHYSSFLPSFLPSFLHSFLPSNTSGLVLVNNWISWTLRPCLWNFPLLSSLPLSGTWGELSFVEHITALTRSCFYHLRQLRVVSRSLSDSSTATKVNVFIVNGLDQCS